MELKMLSANIAAILSRPQCVKLDCNQTDLFPAWFFFFYRTETKGEKSLFIRWNYLEADGLHVSFCPSSHYRSRKDREGLKRRDRDSRGRSNSEWRYEKHSHHLCKRRKHRHDPHPDSSTSVRVSVFPAALGCLTTAGCHDSDGSSLRLP